jgi:hypothetical protein
VGRIFARSSVGRASWVSGASGLAAALVAVGALGAASASPVTALDWRLPRHDGRLSNRTPLPLRMVSAPRELWRIDTRTLLGELELEVASAGKSVEVRPATAVVSTATRQEKPAPAAGAWGRLLHRHQHPQRVAWTEERDGTAKLQCFSYEAGPDQPKLEWESSPEPTIQQPLVILVDVDGDGTPEVASAVHYRVMIHDGVTGSLRTQLRYHDLRNYGYFGSFLEPGDIHPYFVVVADFSNHLDVLHFDGSELRVVFRRDIGQRAAGGIYRHDEIIRPGVDPLRDIDDDNHADLTFSFFNERGDRRWHVVSLDPLTGRKKLDLPGRFLAGVLPPGPGSQRTRLLLERVSGAELSRYEGIEIVTVRKGRATVRFARGEARFARTELGELPGGAASIATGGHSAPLCGAIGPARRRACLVLRTERDVDAARLQALIEGDTRFNLGWSAALRDATFVGAELATGSDGRTRSLMRFVGGRNAAIRIAGARGVVRRWEQNVDLAPAPLAIADRRGLHIVTEVSGGLIAGYRVQPGQAPRMAWSHRGHGMTSANGEPPGRLAAGDLAGDGGPLIVHGGRDRSGSAAIMASDLDGRIRWTATLRGFDSGRPAWNHGGVTAWTVGRFTATGRHDVFVTARRSTMHSDIGLVLDGRDGHEVWRADAVPLPGQPSFGFGGSLVATADLLGTGLDQIVSLYPVVFWVADGRTGRIVKTVSLAGADRFGGWAAYAVPLLGDLRRKGRLDVVVPSSYVHAVITSDGQPVWNAPPAGGGRIDTAEIGNFLGDGVEVVRIARRPGGRPTLEVLAGNSGKLRRQLEVGDLASLATALVADVNGDGADDLVYRAASRTLAAVSFKQGARTLWSIVLPADPLNLIAADRDGDGSGELVVGCADGALVGLGR